MIKILFIITALFLLSAGMFAQIVPPPPAPGEDSIKISTTLIQVDITVTDKKGNIITDLKPEEIEVYENGKKQDITNFQFLTSVKKQNSAESTVETSSKNDNNRVPLPPVKLQPEQVLRTFALVVDDLGLSFESMNKVKSSLKKFINEQMQDGDLVAILRTGRGIGTLQSFTSDRRLLLAAIEKIRWNPQGRAGISTFEAMEQGTIKDALVGRRDADGNAKPIVGVEAEREFLDQINQFREENFSIGTLGSLGYIIRGMRELPGRKSLMLFSDGFDISTGAGGDSGLVKQNRIFDSLRLLADLANRASVIIYTLDPRGLQTPLGLTAQDNTWDAPIGVFDVSGDLAGDFREARTNEFLEKQESLRYLANQTGGLAFINQNDLNVGIDRASNDQDGYYLLGYQPDDETFDPKKSKYNNLEIKVTRPGLKVRYRSGFFGITDEKINNIPKTPQQKLVAALVSPFGASEIGINLYPVFQNDAKAGNMIQALVYIDAKDLQFAKTGENYKANFDIVATTFGDNGVQTNEYAKNYTVEVSEKVYRNMLTNGFVYTLTVPIKKIGAYQFRIALLDTATSKVGSVSQFIEVPNIKKNLILSGLIVDNFTPDEWQKVKSGENTNETGRSVLLDTTVREFKRGTILRYDYVVYNPKRSQQVKSQMRLIRDGKIVYEEQPAAIKTNGQNDMMRLQAAGALSLGNNLEPGSYILQIIATDDSNSKKFATQFVEFEIIE